MTDLPPPPSIPDLVTNAKRPTREDRQGFRAALRKAAWPLFSAMRVLNRLPSSDEQLPAVWNASAPMVRFLKALPEGARVLELGAGPGSLVNFRQWLHPLRPDLRLYAVDLNVSEGMMRYDGWAGIDYKQAFPDQEFDAICSANFVEHIEGGIHALAPWAASRLKPGGQFFVQGPSANMKALEATNTYRNAGFNVSTMNFYDDSTHLDTHTLEEMRKASEDAGFLVEESGYWRNRFIEDEMLRLGRQQAEPTLTTYAIWLKSYVMQYMSAVKV